jgi:hypothetical protein
MSAPEWTTFEAKVNAPDGRPFVQMTCGVGDDPVWATKLSPAVVTALGLRALQSAIEAERDAGLVAYIRDELGAKIGLDTDGEMNSFIALMLDGMRRHREQFDTATGSMRSLGPDDPSDLTEPPA